MQQQTVSLAAAVIAAALTLPACGSDDGGGDAPRFDVPGPPNGTFAAPSTAGDGTLPPAPGQPPATGTAGGGAPAPAQPPATEPPMTQPPATEPPMTQPPATEPPVTEPPVTDPPDMGPAPGEEGPMVGMTAAHNAVRARLATEPPLPPLTWSPTLAAYAQEWADSLTSTACGPISHRAQQMYGENIAMFSGPALSPPMRVVEAWAGEEQCWTYGAIGFGEVCDLGCALAMSSNGCGHYTQLVWRTTTEVGCGVSTCGNPPLMTEVWVCNYSPPGNFVGQPPY